VSDLTLDEQEELELARARAKAKPKAKMSDLTLDEQEELELARARAKAKPKAKTPFEKALAEQPGERFVTVQTPDGPVQLTREGVMVPSPSDVERAKQLEKAKADEASAGTALALASGSPLFGPVMGLRGLLTGEGYTKARRYAQSEADKAAAAGPKLPESIPLVGGAPVLPMVGGAASTFPAGAVRGPLALAGVAGKPLAAAASRVALSGGIGALQGYLGGPSSLMQGDVAGTAKETAMGLGGGLAGGAVGEGLGFGLSKAAGALPRLAERFAVEQAIKAGTGGGRMRNILRKEGYLTPEQQREFGQELIDLGLLKGPAGLPRSATGTHEALLAQLGASGEQLGSIRKLADVIQQRKNMTPLERANSLAAASPSEAPLLQRADDAIAQLQASGANIGESDAAQVARAYESGVAQSAKYGVHTRPDVMEPVLERRMDIVAQGSPRMGPVGVQTTPRATTLGGTYEGLWGQTSRMQETAFEGQPGVDVARARKELMKGGVQSARRELARQMEMTLPAEEAAQHAASMREFSRLKNVEGIIEDTAGRAAANSSVGLGTTQMAQVMFGSGPLATAALPVLALTRGRANAFNALYAPTIARGAGAGMRAGEAASRIGAPVAARQSVSDALGPLRQYLQLTPEEQRQRSIDAFRGAP
jgi:hypothetical protein